MRFRALVVVTIVLGVFAAVQADGLIYRLPDDGSLARYSIKQTMALPKGNPMTVEGSLTLASVGQEKVQNEACRWLEIAIEVKPAAEQRSVKTIFKALIPEKRLQKGEDPLGHWVKGWVKLGDQEPQALTKEQLASPALMINLLVSGPLQDPKTLDKKEIDTKLGKLTCGGVSGSRTLKGAAVSVKDGKVMMGDMTVHVQSYMHDKAPFGVVASRLVVEFPDLGDGKGSAEADLTLLEVQTRAKSELPEQK